MLEKSSDTNIDANLGSGCGSVGRAIASDTRGPQFNSSRGRIFCIEKIKIKKKRPGMAHY